LGISVADYILRLLKEQNVDTIFGVPAFYCYPFFEAQSGPKADAKATSLSPR